MLFVLHFLVPCIFPPAADVAMLQKSARPYHHLSILALAVRGEATISAAVTAITASLRRVKVVG